MGNSVQFWQTGKLIIGCYKGINNSKGKSQNQKLITEFELHKKILTIYDTACQFCQWFSIKLTIVQLSSD